jgi:hypothetical protein
MSLFSNRIGDFDDNIKTYFMNNYI